MNRVMLSHEKETLLIPLYGKALENRKKSPILIDPKAEEIVHEIEYDFNQLKIPEKTNLMMCIRAKIIDDYVKEFIDSHTECTIIHLGCGLDSRCIRIGNEKADWYDLDFPEVIDTRRNFYTESSNYHFIPSSVTEHQWLEHIPAGKRNYIVIAEGLFMYLKQHEIKSLLDAINKRVGSYTLVFDAFSSFAAKKTNRHPSIKKTGATIHWGIDDPMEISEWGIPIKSTTEQFFTDFSDLNKIKRYQFIMFKIAGLFSVAKKAQRILICHIGT